MSVNSPSVLAATYRAHGRKLTPQQQLIFSLLHDNTSHPTAEALYATASHKMPGISLRTVYQTLDELEEMGEVQLMHCDGGAVRFDPNIDDHHHALDAATGEVFDVYVDNLDSLRAKLPEGFEVEQVSIVFRGRVAKVASAKPAQTKAKSPARQQTVRAKSTKRAPRRTSRGSSK